MGHILYISNYLSFSYSGASSYEVVIETDGSSVQDSLIVYRPSITIDELNAGVWYSITIFSRDEKLKTNTNGSETLDIQTGNRLLLVMLNKGAILILFDPRFGFSIRYNNLGFGCETRDPLKFSKNLVNFMKTPFLPGFPT